MYNLTKWLKAIYSDSKLKMTWNTLPIETYKEEWGEIYQYCDEVKVPIFFSKNVDLGEMGQDLLSTYVEVKIDNAGYRQQHDYLLTGAVRNNIDKNKIVLTFTSKFSNWGSKRIVIVSEDGNKVYRNDFKTVYQLSWNDYTEGEYQKKQASTPHVPKLRRPRISTLTESK